MLNLDACLKSAVDGKAITKRQADDIRADWERLMKHRKPGSGPLAGQEALDRMIADIRAGAANKRRQMALRARAQAAVDADLMSHANAKGEAALEEAAAALVEHEGGFGFTSIAYAYKAILGQAHGKMQAMMMHFERGKLAGDLSRQNKADLPNVVRELFGQDTGDAKAKGLAKAWAETAEWLRQRFNASGGAIGKLDNWGLPQYHDRDALMARGLDNWKADIKPLLDVTKMRHPLSGRTVTEDEIDGILDDVFLQITTDGWIDRTPGAQPFGRGMIANQRAEHRFLTFRDADSWLGYSRAYGGGDPFAAMMAHINLMARDIAAMERLGPNPDGTINFVKNRIIQQRELKAGGRPSRIAGRADTRHEDLVDTLWKSYRGTLNAPVNSAMANVFAGGRNLVTSVALGGAVLSSVTDIGTSMLARSFAGIGAKGALPDIVKAFAKSARADAVDAGLILESSTHVFHQQARYVGTLNGPAWTAYVADRVLSLSGLTPWTQAARHAFGLAFQREAAVRTGLGFDRLDKAFADTLTRHGIKPDEWELMRKAGLHETQGGMRLLRPNEIDAKIHPKLATRYLAMIMAETEFAVPTGSHRARTWLVNQNQPGTLIGETIRSFAQFKSFGAVFALLHGKRMHHMLQQGNRQGAAGYAASLAISSFMMGAVAVQLKDIAAGREPRDMSTGKFIGAAFMQGGGLGIWGDFLFADVNRYGGSLGGSIGGPLLEKVSSFADLTYGNLIQLGMGEKTNFGRELTRFVGSNVPGNNIWYTRLVWERVLMDNVQRMLDPEASAAFRRRIRQRERDYGQRYWWAPGQTLPGTP